MDSVDSATIRVIVAHEGGHTVAFNDYPYGSAPERSYMESLADPCPLTFPPSIPYFNSLPNGYSQSQDLYKLTIK